MHAKVLLLAAVALTLSAEYRISVGPSPFRQFKIAPRSLAKIYLRSDQGELPSLNANSKIEVLVQPDSGPSLAATVLNADVWIIEAALPADVPLGPASIRVIVNGEESHPTTGVIVRSDLRMLTLGFDSGPARAHNARPGIIQPNGLTTPARAGDYVHLWSTGLGNIGTDGVRATLFGEPVEVTYAGPAQGWPGHDQIVVRMPAALDRAECYATVTVTAGDEPPKSVSLSVGSDMLCPHPLGLTYSEMRDLDAGNFIVLGSISMSTQVDTPFDDRTALIRIDQGMVSLRPEAAGDVWWAAQPRIPYSGPCVARVSQSAGGAVTGFGVVLRPPPIPHLGDTLRLTGPDRTYALVADQRLKGQYAVRFPPSPRLPLVAEPPPSGWTAGTWTLQTDGSTDAEPFRFPFALLPAIQILNRTDVLQIDRSRDATVRWNSAGMPPDVLLSATLTSESGDVLCSAPAASGELRIPAEVLRQLRSSEYGRLDLRLNGERRWLDIPLRNGERVRTVFDQWSNERLPVTIR